MIGRVLTFVACVYLVSAASETCNTSNSAVTYGTDTCCMPISDSVGWNGQLVGADKNSYPPPTLVEAESGFITGTAGFRFTVLMARQFTEGPSVSGANSGPAMNTADLDLPGTAEDVTYSGLPVIKVAKLNGLGTHPSAGTREGSGAFTRKDGTCTNKVAYNFLFSDITSSGDYHKTTASGGYKYVYAAMNIIGATKIYGDTFKTTPQTRLVVETMTYKFKFKTSVDASTTATVTYAAIDYNVVLTLSKIEAPDTSDWTTLRQNKSVYSKGRHADCSNPAGTGQTDEQAVDFCAVNPEIRLTVGISTVVPKEYVTTLRTSTDIYAPASGINPFPSSAGFKIKNADFFSGLDWVDNAVTSLRVNGLNDQAGTQGNLDGTPGIFHTDSASNCYSTTTGSCTQRYLLYFKYEHVHNESNVNYWTPSALGTPSSVVANTQSDRCQLKGAKIIVGNGSSLSNQAELWCRNEISFDLAYATTDVFTRQLTADPHGVGSTNWPSLANASGSNAFRTTYAFTGSAKFPSPNEICPFAADKSDLEDDISAEITITTSDWCPVVAVDNGVDSEMDTSKQTFFSDEQIRLYARAKRKVDTSLKPTQLVWKSVYGKCPDTAGAECDILGGAGASSKSDKKLFVKTSVVVGHGADPPAADGGTGANGDKYMDLGWSATGAPSGSNTNCLPSSSDAYDAAWDCNVEASFNLCEHIASGWATSAACGTGTNPEAFAIDDSASSTGIDFVAVLSVGFPNVNAQRKRETTIQLSPSKEVMYSLLQSQSEEAELEVSIGYGPRPVTEESVEQSEAETTGANNPVVEEAAPVEESNSMLIYIIVGVFLFISVFVGALVMYLRRSKNEKKVHPVPITVEVNKSTAAMA